MSHSAVHPGDRSRGGAPLDPQEWLHRHGDYLYRYALTRVRRKEVAEDLVQEALLGAWRGRAKFDGRATERSWLTAILKRKVIDWLRAKVRDQLEAEQGDDGSVDSEFTSGGKWCTGPDPWSTAAPGAGVERAEFWDTIHGCLGKLPVRLRDVFVLWHLDERSSDEVCRAMRVTRRNLWVMLHRSRLRMWRCLSRNWYGVEPNDWEGRAEL